MCKQLAKVVTEPDGMARSWTHNLTIVSRTY